MDHPTWTISASATTAITFHIDAIVVYYQLAACSSLSGPRQVFISTAWSMIALLYIIDHPTWTIYPSATTAITFQIDSIGVYYQLAACSNISGPGQVFIAPCLFHDSITCAQRCIVVLFALHSGTTECVVIRWEKCMIKVKVYKVKVPIHSPDTPVGWSY